MANMVQPSRRQSGGASIAANGGWEETRRMGRPRYQLFSMLALLWWFPSLGALWIAGSGVAKLPKQPENAGLSYIPVEVWIALAALLAHAVFAILAWHYWRTEQPREVVGHAPAPEQNLEKL